MRNILVTGGAGFIGSNLTLALQERHPDAHEGTPGMVWSVAVLGALSLGLGIAIYYPSTLAGIVLEQIRMR